MSVKTGVNPFKALAQRDKELKQIQKASDQSARDAKRLATGLTQDLKARDHELATLRVKLTKLESRKATPTPRKAKAQAKKDPQRRDRDG